MLDKNALGSSAQYSIEHRGILMLIKLGGQAGALNAGVREKIRLGLVKIGSSPKSVEILKSSQKGLWNLFEDMLAISWQIPENDEEARLRIQKDIATIEQVLLPLLRQYYVVTEQDVEWFIDEGVILGGDREADSWRTLFGATLVRWKSDTIVVD